MKYGFGGGKTSGVIGKLSISGEIKPVWQLKQAMRRHCDNSLHKWCARKAEEEKIVNKTFEEENKTVAFNVIRAYLKNARRGLGSADFQADIDFQHLTPGVPKSQKNDSRSTFFQLRDDTFEVLTGEVHNLFKGDLITELSVTLDKVTIQHRTFTVLLCFFFYEGSIYCLLNDLLKMEDDDYNDPGTAGMVVCCLVLTLGLTDQNTVGFYIGAL